jgi:hypothetical protein
VPHLSVRKWSACKWDERPFIRMIEEKRFSAILTTSEGVKNSDRYTPAVAEAIDGAYQETRIGTKYKNLRATHELN